MANRRWLLEVGLLVRGLCFLGRRHECPICGWTFRTFVRGGGSFRARPAGYCPRCNSKGRHRLLWLSMDRAALLEERVQLLHISPHYSLGRKLSRMRRIGYVGVDLNPGPYAAVQADVTSLPFEDEEFDGVVCVHVLEHVLDDERAIGELYRVVVPEGWVLVNVPMSGDAVTFEDETIRSPRHRREAFGEETHVRVYGDDVVGRLQRPGFEVEIFAPVSYSAPELARFGLPTDETSFLCVKGSGEAR